MQRKLISISSTLLLLGASVCFPPMASACTGTNCSEQDSYTSHDTSIETSDFGSDYSVSASDAYRSAGDAAGAGGGFVPAVSEGPGRQWAPAAAGDWAPAGSGGGGGGVDPVEECRRLVANPDPTVTTSCLYPVFRTTGPDTPASGGPAAGPAVDPAEAARRAIASLTLTEPGLLLDPDPAANEWGATAVGFHTWFHAPDPGVLHTSVTADGLTIDITATPGALTVDTGDGRRQTCHHTVPYRNPDGVNAPSPYCGHTWEHTGEYTVTATRTWNVSWTAAGRSGTDTVTRPAGTRAITVIELVSVLTEPDR